MLDLDLVNRTSTKLAHTFGDAVHAVDVGLAQLATMGVEGEPAANLDGAAGDEILGLSPAAESQFLELNQRERGEVVVEDRGLNIPRPQLSLRPELLAHQAHFRQPVRTWR